MAATTNGDTSTERRKFPEIFLDTTLAELLAQDSPGDVDEALCNFKPCADPLHKTVPLNKKYLITSTKANDSNDIAHLQLENVSYLLSFWAGHMEVLMVACEGWTNDKTLTKEIIDRNAQTSFSVLNEKQRPRPRVFANREDYIQHYKTSKNRIRWGFAVDFAEQVPCVISPDRQFLLNSKRWLAKCPLLSANDQIIDPSCTCPTHTTKDDNGNNLWYYGGPNCTTCTTTITTDLDGLKTTLTNKPPPFVLKLTQSLGSVGTMLVKTDEDKQSTIKSILATQRECLPYITPNNAHIHPASLILSDFLPGSTHALNFFIHRSGSVTFLGSCAQLGTRTTGSGRQHTSLTWSDQAHLQQKFQSTLDEIGAHLHSAQGYFGPCGADIMIHAGENDRQYVIDLNVRTPTSLVLYLLGSHCKDRGFDVCAVYECLMLRLDREELQERFEGDFREGRVIVLGTTRLGEKDVWAYPVVVCGEDAEVVKVTGEKLIEFEVGTVGGGGHDGDQDGAREAGGA